MHVRTFTLSFFGIFATDSLPKRAVTFTVQMISLFYSKAMYCPIKHDSLYAASFLKVCFEVIETLIYFCAIVFTVSVIWIRKGKIRVVLSETSRLAAVLRKLLKTRRVSSDAVFARRILWFGLGHCLFSWLYPALCLVGASICSNCTFGSVVMDFHYFMVSTLFCLLATRTERLIDDVHYGLSVAAAVRDRFLMREMFRLLRSVHERSRELADVINECFAVVNLVYFAVEMPMIVITTVYGIDGYLITECISWIAIYVLNMFMRTFFGSRLRQKRSIGFDGVKPLHRLALDYVVATAAICGTYYLVCRYRIFGECLFCSNVGIIHQFHYSMTLTLFSLLISNIQCVFANINCLLERKMRKSDVLRSAIKTAASTHHRVSDLTQSVNECFTEINAGSFFLYFTIFVNSVFYTGMGVLAIDYCCWFSLCLLGAMQLVTFSTKLNKEVSTAFLSLQKLPPVCI
ncbi:UNVERIFIED_CONTAM: hypothetical protein PYX00_006025 [Menopon gallinae]|uniref:Gustatory receptor n=1 Tax=Menopon gallinae TaxID=328185 RepID=A0AAW2HU49_9NEOP